MSNLWLPAAARSCCLFAVVSVGLAGCPGGPSRVAPPAINPRAAGEAAIAEFDRTGDGLLSRDEAQASPGLAFAFDLIDTNGDGQLSSAEIAARIQSWLDARLGLTTILCEVTLAGQPLDGATVTLEPAAFLGPAVKGATGVTQRGRASLSLAEADRPEPDLTGVACGFYTVRIRQESGGQQRIPARYNAESTLGVEVAPDSAFMQEGLRFELTR